MACMGDNNHAVIKLSHGVLMEIVAQTIGCGDGEDDYNRLKAFVVRICDLILDAVHTDRDKLKSMSQIKCAVDCLLLFLKLRDISQDDLEDDDEDEVDDPFFQQIYHDTEGDGDGMDVDKHINGDVLSVRGC